MSKPDFEFRLRRDVAADWTAADPVLAAGEPGIETDTRRFKLGDGFTIWSLLPYYIHEDDIAQMIEDAVLVGVPGPQGDSAYEVAVENGFIGTEEEWLESLQGVPGEDGADGTNGTNGANGSAGTNGTNGTDGDDGAPGISAYQVAVNNGFVGNEATWLASLVGPAGEDGAAGTNGTNGTNGADGDDGAPGISAYQVAVNNGFVGNEAAWLTSLQGDPGADGADGTNGSDGADGADGDPGPAGETYPLSGYGFIAASMPIEAATTDSEHGTSWVTRVWVPAGKAITGVGTFVTVDGTTGSGNNGFAVYEEDGDDGIFAMATTPDDELWNVPSSWVLKDLTAPIAAQSTGRFVRVGSSASSAGNPWVIYFSIGASENLMKGGLTGSIHRRAISGVSTFSSSWPGTIDLTAGVTYNYLPLIVLY